MRVIEKIKTFLNIRYDMKEGRNPHIDALKGIAMIVVVWGHSVQVNDPNFSYNPLYLTNYPWAMPMFMMLSGFILFTQLSSTVLDYVKKYALRLILPFFVWALVSYVFFHFYRDVSLPAYLWSVAKAPGTHLWFLWNLFINAVVLFLVLKLVRVKNWVRWENYFVIASMLFSRAFSSDYFGLSDFKVYYPYYAAGYFVFKYWDWLIAHRKVIYAFGLISFPLLVLGYRRNELPTFYPFLLNIFGETGLARLIVSVYKYVIAFAGMALVAFLIDLVRKTRLYVFLCWVGTLTLDIYVCHRYFLNFGVGSGVWQYLSAALFGFFGSLALTLLVLRRFRISRLLFLGEPFWKKKNLSSTSGE